jgi:hypothetical protein
MVCDQTAKTADNIDWFGMYEVSKAHLDAAHACSGHFLCGVSRLSPRSILATATFFTTALLTANIFPLHLPISPNGIFHSSLPNTTRSILLPCTIALGNVAQSRLRSYLLRTKPATPLMRSLPYLLASTTFSLGLVISGMSNPQKVLAFLRPSSPVFDPSLALIVVSGVLPNGIHWARSRKGKVALPWETWRVGRMWIGG